MPSRLLVLVLTVALGAGVGGCDSVKITAAPAKITGGSSTPVVATKRNSIGTPVVGAVVNFTSDNPVGRVTTPATTVAGGTATSTFSAAVVLVNTPVNVTAESDESDTKTIVVIPPPTVDRTSIQGAVITIQPDVSGGAGTYTWTYTISATGWSFSKVDVSFQVPVEYDGYSGETPVSGSLNGPSVGVKRTSFTWFRAPGGSAGDWTGLTLTFTATDVTPNGAATFRLSDGATSATITPGGPAR